MQLEKIRNTYLILLINHDFSCSLPKVHFHEADCLPLLSFFNKASMCVQLVPWIQFHAYNTLVCALA
jgi:hypothetical protein